MSDDNIHILLESSDHVRRDILVVVRVNTIRKRLMMRNIGLNLGFSSRTYGYPYNQVTNYKFDSCGYDAKI